MEVMNRKTAEVGGKGSIPSQTAREVCNTREWFSGRGMVWDEEVAGGGNRGSGREKEMWW